MFYLWKTITYLIALTLVCEIYGFNIDKDEEPGDFNGDSTIMIPNEEVFHRIHSMIDAYRKDVLEMDVPSSLADIKYRTWKRNADVINSLLGLPKGMLQAGR